MDSSSLSGLSGVQKDELMDQVKQQIAVANAQELLTVSQLNLLQNDINILISTEND